MSKKKGAQSRPARAGKGGGGGGEAEPLKVNWYVLGGAVLILGTIVFFSIRQSPGGPVASDGSCTPKAQQWPSPPAMTVDASKQYTATFKLQKGGEFVVQLFPDKAPITVNNFVFLARQGYYDCVTFHRVLDGFMAQSGDPTGTGTGGPGYEFQDEFSDLTFDRAGLVAMANTNNPEAGILGTNGSQFFITYAPTPWLDGRHTIFGEVIEGMEVVNGLIRRDPDLAPDFQGDVIEGVTITES